MRRRDLLMTALGAAASAPLAKAEIACTPWNAQGFRRCEVGVNVRVGTARQRCQNWCWAACVEAVFALNGYRVAQEHIVDKLYGGPVCAPSSGAGIAAAINGVWRSPGGDSFTAVAEVLWDLQYAFGRPDRVEQAANELAQGYPLIVGALGHATVMTGMSYTLAANGAYRIDGIMVRDPWPGHPNRRLLTPQEAMATNFLTKVYVI
jgi:hypothetical protein